MATTLAQLRSRAQQRSDMSASAFVSTAEWNSYINESYSELWDLVVACYADTFFSSFNFTLSGNTSSTNSTTFPSDFYMTRGLERDPDTTNRFMVPRFMWNERDALIGKLSYREMGSSVYLEPYEISAGSYRLYYVPQYVPLSADGDFVDGRVVLWDECIVLGAAIKALAKEESDTAVHERQLERQFARVKNMAAQRDQGQADRVTDVQTRPWPYPYLPRPL